jgi:hypothetical protein
VVALPISDFGFLSLHDGFEVIPFLSKAIAQFSILAQSSFNIFGFCCVSKVKNVQDKLLRVVRFDQILQCICSNSCSDCKVASDWNT